MVETQRLQLKILISTAIGEAEKNNVVYRNGAKETDLIVVTGDLGAAYLGLRIGKRKTGISGKS